MSPEPPVDSRLRAQMDRLDTMGSAHFVPRLPPGLIDRPRVLGRMPGREPPALTVVHGAAGMGKSTLLAQWATSHPGDYSVVWVSLSASTAGRFALWRAVLDRVLDSGIAGAGARLADIAPASPVAHTLRASLGRGLAEIPGRFVVVLDDYQTVRDSQVDDDIIWLLAEVPSLSIVISTRDAAQLTSSLARSQVEVVVIDHDALVLTSAEVTELASAAGAPLPAVRGLHAVTRGWPMLVRAELVELAAGGRAGLGRNRGLGAAVGRIVRSVLETAAPEQASFILRISIAEAVPLELASALTGEPSAVAATRFAELEAKALGTLNVESGSEVFRFHPLLREEFEHVLESTSGEDETALRHGLAIWLSDHEQPLAAVRQAVLVKDWQLLDVIRSRHGSTLTMTHPMTYLELLRTIPDDVMFRYPGLQLSRSLLSVRRDRRMPASIRHIGGAIATLAAARNAKEENRSELSRLWNRGILMILHRLGGRADAAASAAAEVAHSVESLSPDDRDSAGSYVALTHSHLAITHLHLGNEAEAYHHAQLDLEAAEHYANEWEAVHAIGLTSWSLAAQGDIVGARRWLETARGAIRPDGWKDSYVGTGYRLAEAIVALESFDHETAERHIRALDFHAPTIEHWPFMLQAEGMIALTRGTARDGARAVAAIVGARRRRSMFPHVDQIIASTRATLDSALGDSAGAHVDGSNSNSPVARVAMARVALVEGRYEQALILSQLPAASSPRLTAESLIVKSLAALKLGSATASAEALSSADALMRRYGMRQPLMLVPRKLLEEAVQNLGTRLDLADVPDRFGVTRSVAALTRRELVVLNQLTKTSNLDTIAQELVVSRNTVKGQVSSLYRKLGVTNRADALVVAVELGLVTAA
jgi:LuxR family maltose regulon positive regulatory protein